MPVRQSSGAVAIESKLPTAEASMKVATSRQPKTAGSAAVVSFSTTSTTRGGTDRGRRVRFEEEASI